MRDTAVSSDAAETASLAISLSARWRWACGLDHFGLQRLDRGARRLQASLLQAEVVLRQRVVELGEDLSLLDLGAFLEQDGRQAAGNVGRDGRSAAGDDIAGGDEAAARSGGGQLMQASRRRRCSR